MNNETDSKQRALETVTSQVQVPDPGTSFGRAPGKLILSGEHAVVYGAPALTVAVDRYTDVWFTPMHKMGGLRTAFGALSQGQLYPLERLKSFKDRLDRRFDQFLQGDLPVQNILKRPDDLVVYTLSSLVHYLPVPGVSETHKLPVPGQLSSRSNLPLGAGMGSSAAVIAATLTLYEHLLNTPKSTEDRFQQVRTCERLQHGKGSAVDAAAVVFGGLNRIVDGQASQLDIATDNSLVHGNNWYWVLHGTPISSTGECVANVRKSSGHDQALWDAFEACTEQLLADLQGAGEPLQVIRENQRLLERIGVVTTSAQQLAKAIEDAGGAAKISGAGAVRGEPGGIMLVYLPDPDSLQGLTRLYPDLCWEPLKIATQGASLQTED